ncbi:GEVED domain-containing protein, partial [Luteimonas sp. C3_2_a3]
MNEVRGKSNEHAHAVDAGMSMRATHRPSHRRRTAHGLRGRRRVLAMLLLGLAVLLGIGPAFADSFYFTRMSTGSGADTGSTGLFQWNDVTGAQSQIGGDGTYLRHATDGAIPVDGIATNAAGTLYGFAIDDTATAGFIPLPSTVFCTASMRSRLVSINIGTGVMTYVGASWLNGRDIRAAGFDGQGRLWGLDCVTNEILQINPASGAIVASMASGFVGNEGTHSDIDFAANGFGMIGNATLRFRVFDPDAGWVADTPITAQSVGFDSTLVPPYIVGGLAFTSHLAARNGSPAAETCRLNLAEMRGLDELGHVNDPFFANPSIAFKEADQYDPPNRPVAWFNGGTGDMARVGGPALPDCFYDWGDAPNSYGTLLAGNGARHAIVAGSPYLGAGLPDFEVDGQPNAGATGDNSVGTDDEDGVTVPAVPVGATVQIEVTAGNVGPGTLLQGWIDWAGDGSFAQAGDQVLVDAAVTTGINTFDIAVPAAATVGT